MRITPRGVAFAAALLAFAVPGARTEDTPAKSHSIRDFVMHDRFEDIRLSKGGSYYAATVRQEDKVILVFMRREDLEITGMFRFSGDINVDAFWWVSDERVLLTAAQEEGLLDQPISTGEIYASDADGSRQELLIGYRAGVITGGTGAGNVATRIRPREPERVSAHMIDVIDDDEDSVLIAVWPWSHEGDPYTTAERMDVDSGRRRVVARAPVRRADFVADHDANVRFARGSTTDNHTRTYYRDDDRAEWVLINDQRESGRDVLPMGFSADNATAYLRVHEASGPDGIYAFDTKTREMTRVQRGDFSDPLVLLRDPASRTPVGALYMEGKPTVRFFDEDHPFVRTYRSLANSFDDQLVWIDSSTRDGNLMLVHVSSDRNPGEYYLFDAKNKSADFVIADRHWIDPRLMSPMQPVSLTARDGLALHGYLTVPHGREAKGLPLVVFPHGGPFGEFDKWGFDPDVQLIASHGFAVLQVNFRGSGMYGAEFEWKGYRQWGGAMQDDLTDATKWAIDQGIANPERICIVGASYGGYAALMGVAKEPDLYRCAIGYVGVYDLPMMHERGDTQRVRWGANYLAETLGTENLESVSPTRLAHRIEAAVFLAAGGEDKRAPVEHTEAMQRALEAAGKQVETVIYDREGHGFYQEDNRVDFYSRLVNFLQRHIGAGATRTSTAAEADAEADADADADAEENASVGEDA